MRTIAYVLVGTRWAAISVVFCLIDVSDVVLYCDRPAPRIPRLDVMSAQSSLQHLARTIQVHSEDQPQFACGKFFGTGLNEIVVTYCSSQQQPPKKEDQGSVPSSYT